jgi:hypothetical protein
MNTYTAGTLIQLNLAVTTPAGSPISPTTVTFKIQTPDGVVTDYSSSVLVVSTGVYYAQFNPVQVGLHQYEWIGTGVAQVASVSQFLVNQSTF